MKGDIHELAQNEQHTFCKNVIDKKVLQLHFSSLLAVDKSSHRPNWNGMLDIFYIPTS